MPLCTPSTVFCCCCLFFQNLHSLYKVNHQEEGRKEIGGIKKKWCKCLPLNNETTLCNQMASCSRIYERYIVISSFIIKTSRRRCISTVVRDLQGWGRPCILTLHIELGHWNDKGTICETFIWGVSLYIFFWMRKKRCYTI